MISLFAYHADIAHWNVYIHIYTHNVHTYLYTQTYTCVCLCARIYFRAAHWWDDKTPKLFRCESLKYQRTMVFIKKTTLLNRRVRWALWGTTLISLNFSRTCGWRPKPSEHSPDRAHVSKLLGCGHLSLAFPGRSSTQLIPIPTCVGGFRGDDQKSTMNASNKAPQGDFVLGNFRSDALFSAVCECYLFSFNHVIQNHQFKGKGTGVIK